LENGPLKKALMLSDFKEVMRDNTNVYFFYDDV
jgi:hypothetical protein